MPSLKDKFNRLLGSTMGGRGASVLGVDVSSSSIKVVQLRKKRGKAVLETYGELALGPYAKVEAGQATNLPPETIAEGLKDVLREAKVTTKNCGVAIPLSSSLISVIEIPKMDEKQLRGAIPIEARKYIPVPISDVLLDWSIVPIVGPDENPEEAKKLSVLIVAIHKDTITKYQKIIQASGLEATFFEIEIFSTIRSTVDRGITPIMILDLGVSTTKLYIIEAGIVRSSHTVGRGSQDITQAISHSMGISLKEAEDLKISVGISPADQAKEMSDTTSVVLEHIFAEAKRVMLNYEKKYNKPVTKTFLAGGGSLLKGLSEVAADRLNMEVEVANPFRKVETPAFLEDVLLRAGPEFAVAIGTALRKLEELS